MTRISTSTTYESALLNILNAQNRLGVSETQVSSGKVADDLKGYGVRADSLTAARSLKSRLDGYVESSRSLTSTLDVQDHALEQLASAALSARGAVAEALATGSAVGLMASLEGYLGQAIDALNTEYQGRHLFAGGQTDGEPLGALTLADLTAAPTIASLFGNDQLELTRRLDDKMSMKIGMLANELGEPLFTALEAVQAIHEGGSGPFDGSLTAAQTAALTALVTTFDQAWAGLNEKVAENGGMQTRLEAVQTSLLDRQTALEGVLGEMVDVDMAAAVSRLQLAQTALQASANVFATLTGSSLLNVLGGR
jgi:flagellar hook-associated protein 3 FlgL